MPGADACGDARRGSALIDGLRHVEAGGEGQHRRLAMGSGAGLLACHHRQDAGAIDAAREEHPIGDIATQVQRDALRQGGIKPGEGGGPVDVLRTTFRQGGAALPGGDRAVGDDQGLPRQHPVDALEDRRPARGELQLQQVRAGFHPHLRGDQASGDKGLRLGREGDAIGDLGHIKRLDAEGIAREDHLARSAVFDRDRIHAAQCLGEGDPVAAP